MTLTLVQFYRKRKIDRLSLKTPDKLFTFHTTEILKRLHFLPGLWAKTGDDDAKPVISNLSTLDRILEDFSEDNFSSVVWTGP